ncbi:putative aminopeptidase npepl1 [Chytriomyces hyalinus]|nr:putative aminopeptidase npepl1 [Chytriomyces hyalinus]
MTAVVFRSVTTDLTAANSDFGNAATVLIIGEKASLVAENALPLSGLSLASDFIRPIADGSTDSLTSYVAGKAVTVATFSDKKSRTLGPIRGDAIHEVVSKHSGKGDAVILVHVSSEDQILTAALSIARVFPTYSRKQSSAASRTLNIHFVLPTAPKSTITSTTRTTTTTRTATINGVSATASTTTTAKTIQTKQKVDVAKIQAVADAVRDAAHLVDTAPNELNPTTYTAIVQDVWKSKLEALGVTMKVIRGTELRDQGYGGIWSVGMASENPPALIVLSHTPANAHKTVAWVGKGITFDTGGLDLKVGGGMVGMKSDMGGSAGIFHAFVATVVNGINTNFNLHAVLCVAENSLDSRSFRPDDVIHAYSGKTVEVTDTDAEGRLVLMDGVAHATKDLKADVVVDMATLTGAQPYATGVRHAGFISNSEEFEGMVVDAGKASGDLARAMLYCPEYLAVDTAFKSQVADMINYSGGGIDRVNAPSSAAGFFVGAHLVPEEKWVENGEGMWAHIDMALPSKINGKASGYGVGILYALAESLNAKYAQ